MGRIVFPPYGFFDQDETLQLGLRYPLDWRGTPNSNLSREEQWRVWRDGVVQHINDVLWPAWDPLGEDWKPAPSVNRMEYLLDGDFEVFDIMERKYPARGLDSLPDSPNRSPLCFSQRDLFVIEDDRILDGMTAVIPFASYYGLYDSELPDKIAASVAPLWFRAVKFKLSTASHQIKEILQKPRPYQMALVMGHPRFVNEFGKTAVTPASCSGHCLQGMTGMGGVYEHFLEFGLPADGNHSTSMQQYAVDIGDRRVMAGLHYPSDNLCSWIILMHLADRVYQNPKVKHWLWQAIEDRSVVYREVAEYAEQHNGSAYQPALDHLRSVACGRK